MTLLRWLAAIAICVPLYAAPPARGVADFEKSNFCRKYRCVLSDPIEPLRMRGVIVEYFYNYRVYFQGEPLAQIGMRIKEALRERGGPAMVFGRDQGRRQDRQSRSMAIAARRLPSFLTAHRTRDNSACGLLPMAATAILI